MAKIKSYDLVNELIGIPWPCIDIMTNEVGMYKPIVKVYPVSNLAGVVVSLGDTEDYRNGVPVALLFISYAEAAKLVDDKRKVKRKR